MHHAVVIRQQYDVVMYLLEHGADYEIPHRASRLIHDIAEMEPIVDRERRPTYEQVVKWLEDHGQSLQQAKRDLERWESYRPTINSAYANELMEKEVAESKAAWEAKRKKSKAK